MNLNIILEAANPEDHDLALQELGDLLFPNSAGSEYVLEEFINGQEFGAVLRKFWVNGISEFSSMFCESIEERIKVIKKKNAKLNDFLNEE